MFYEDLSTYNFAVSSINGVNINNTLQIGIGVELQVIETRTYIPLYLDAQVNFSKRPNTFSANASGGVALSNSSENILLPAVDGTLFEKAVNYESGFLGRLGFGDRSKISEKMNAVVGLNYTAQSFESHSYLYENLYYDVEGIYSIIGLKLGIEL